MPSASLPRSLLQCGAEENPSGFSTGIPFFLGSRLVFDTAGPLQDSVWIVSAWRFRKHIAQGGRGDEDCVKIRSTERE